MICDIREVLDLGWGLLAVMHPPCTRLCNSGLRWLHVPPTNAPAEAQPDERAAWPNLPEEARRAIMWWLLDEGAALFSACWRAPIPRVAVENPVMHPHGRARLPGDLPKPQIVHARNIAARSTRSERRTGRRISRACAAATSSRPATPMQGNGEKQTRWSKCFPYSRAMRGIWNGSTSTRPKASRSSKAAVTNRGRPGHLTPFRAKPKAPP
ncbi:hypothetical protein BYZ73_19570 [Rhodovulum viride]|uniref:Uncharacterized protein n=1 Tax=Rhodovulum viride TaxID=1231134 RepID=A0ABX9DBA0_9RHOB|nr:hypothetical protein BYZ73_19570 [Rhodovulum viride]